MIMTFRLKLFYHSHQTEIGRLSNIPFRGEGKGVHELIFLKFYTVKQSSTYGATLNIFKLMKIVPKELSSF